MPKFEAKIDTSRIPITGVIPEPQANDASVPSPVNGLLYYDTTLHQLKVRLNGAWVALGAAGAGGPPSGAASGDLSGSYPGPTIGLGKVIGDRIATDAVTDTKILNGTITGAKLAGDTVTVDKMAPNSVGQSELVADAVITAKILDSNVTLAKLDGTTVKLNTIGLPTGSLGLNSNKIINLANGTGANDAVNLSQLEGLAAGIDVRASVRIASTANLGLISLTAIDGVTPIAGDRVLAKDQSAPAANGIYIAAVGAWTRAPDMDAWTEIPGAFTFVEEGTTNADTGWVCTSNAGGTLNTTAIVWAKFTAAASVTPGAGSLANGSAFDVGAGASSGITVNADDILVKIVAGTSGLALSASGLALDTALAARKFTSSGPALTAGVWSSSINHNLGQVNPDVSFKDGTSTEGIVLDWKAVDANNIQIRADVARTAATYAVTVIG
jgi:hypothetical protein